MRFQGNGAPGETRTPDLLVRSHKSKNAKCPIWRRLRTGNAILPSISCAQSCTQNRIISNLYRTLHEFNPKSRFWPSSKPGSGEITIRQSQSRQKRDRQIHNRRSPEVNFGRSLADLRSTPVWWRRAKFSSWTAARKRKIENRVARSVAREMSIRGEQCGTV